MAFLRLALVAFTATLLGVLNPAFGQVEQGDRREDVLRVLGYPDYSGRMGETETLNYKNGTKIVLRNSVVQEVSVPGQIRIGNSVKVIEVARPQPTPTAAPIAKPAAETKATVAKPAEPTSAPSATMATANEVSKTTAESAKTSRAVVSSVAKAQSVSGATATADASGTIAQIKRIVAGLFVVFAVVSLVMYGFSCFCFKLICEKAGKPGGALVWIPIAQFIPLLRVAGMREWMLVLLLIPVINLGFVFMLWAKICIARERSPWLAASLIVPFGGLALIAYLAFTAANESNEEAPAVVHVVPEGVEPMATTEENPAEPVPAENFSETPFAEMPDPSAPGPAIEQPSPAT